MAGPAVFHFWVMWYEVAVAEYWGTDNCFFSVETKEESTDITTYNTELLWVIWPDLLASSLVT